MRFKAEFLPKLGSQSKETFLLAYLWRSRLGLDNLLGRCETSPTSVRPHELLWYRDCSLAKVLREEYLDAVRRHPGGNRSHRHDLEKYCINKSATILWGKQDFLIIRISKKTFITRITVSNGIDVEVQGIVRSFPQVSFHLKLLLTLHYDIAPWGMRCVKDVVKDERKSTWSESLIQHVDLKALV